MIMAHWLSHLFLKILFISALILVNTVTSFDFDYWDPLGNRFIEEPRVEVVTSSQNTGI